MIKRILKFFKNLLWEREISARDMVEKRKWTIEWGSIDRERSSTGRAAGLYPVLGADYPKVAGSSPAAPTNKKPSNNWVTFNFWPWSVNISGEVSLPFIKGEEFIVIGGRESRSEKRIKSICISTRGIHLW